MKIALIPPTPELDRWGNRTSMHLLLAHVANERYVSHYKERAMAGDYLILDNGAHESGKSVALPPLFDLARRVGAQELVVPDVPRDGPATVEAARRTFKWLTGSTGRTMYDAAGQPQLMLVPQGRTKREWINCLNELLVLHSRHLTERLPVIGLAKNHDELPGMWHHVLLSWLVKHCMTSDVADVHLLGWPKDLFTIHDAAREHEWIRSVDSAKPFVYAIDEIAITADDFMPPYPKRPDDYFERPIGASRHELVEHNIEMFRLLARGEA